MRKLGTKQLSIHLQQPLVTLPASLAEFPLTLVDEGYELIYTFDALKEQTGIAGLLRAMAQEGIDFKDLHSSQSSLEDIFVELVNGRGGSTTATPSVQVTS